MAIYARRSIDEGLELVGWVGGLGSGLRQRAEQEVWRRLLHGLRPSE